MRSFLLLAIVAGIALLAGIAVTGVPQSVPDDVVASDINTTTAGSTSTTSAPATTSAPPPRVEEPTGSTLDTKPTEVTATAATPAPAATAATTIASESSVRVVVANASDASGIASRTAEELRGLGYATVSATNAATVRPDTVVVFAPGFEAEAARLASQLQVPAERITALTNDPLTINDTPGDLWVLLGFDRS